MRGRKAAIAVLLPLVLPLGAVSACSGSPSGSGGPLTVSAAASLTEAFTELADAFEADHPGTTVRLNFGGSGSLAEQVMSGAPVDVLATASRATMATVVEAGYSAEGTTFARNAITMAVPRGNPAGIRSLADLGGDGVRTAECAPEVPCGAAARETIENAGLSVTPVTLDPDVKTVLGRVASGEVDAGLVYVTDIASAEVEEVPIPSDVAATTDYAIAVIDGSGAPELAREFADLVLGPDGQAVMGRYGFGSP
jgi:molybdate transport system substrate-binding protein